MELPAYPVDLVAEPEGGFTVTFPDVPEAITHGRDRDEALQEAAAALASALSFYADADRPLPAPAPADGRPLVQVSLLAAAKLALRAALAESGLSQADLARRLGCDPKAVRRLRRLARRRDLELFEEPGEGSHRKIRPSGECRWSCQPIPSTSWRNPRAASP